MQNDEKQSTVASPIEPVVMCADLELLYTLKDAVNIMVAENFGYSPNTDNYNRLENNWRDQEFIVKSMYPEEYKVYENKEYT
jgi:hypothetical protein